MIPLAFHVDYWDYLGWPDRFATAAFSQRQRFHAAQNRSRTVYTPQVVLQGRDFRQHARFRQAVGRINQRHARAHISLQVMPQPTAIAVTAHITVTEQASLPYAVAYLALYENNLSTGVTAGENRGRTLRHDAVVRHWVGPLEPDQRGKFLVQQRLNLEKDWKYADLGVAVCVFHLKDSDVLQAVALPLQSAQHTEDTPRR